MACDIDAFKPLFHGMLEAGIYLAPSAFEAGFVSQAHTEEDIVGRPSTLSPDVLLKNMGMACAGARALSPETGPSSAARRAGRRTRSKSVTPFLHEHIFIDEEIAGACAGCPAPGWRGRRRP